MQDNCSDSHRVTDYASILHAFALDHPDEPDKRLKGSRISPADLTDLQERFRVTELREQDVARLTARNAETEPRRVEQHNLNLLKEVIPLKQAAAVTSVRPKHGRSDSTA